jgi:hypothetical protein
MRVVVMGVGTKEKVGLKVKRTAVERVGGANWGWVVTTCHVALVKSLSAKLRNRS